MEKKIADVLKEAKTLISNPKNWTQFAIARNKDGNSIDSSNAEAVCFCSVGALDRVTDGEEDYEKVLDFMLEYSELISIAKFNDFHTHEEVMEMWDKVIAAAEKQGI